MQGKLFSVRLNNYDLFFVIANNHSDAIKKVERRVNVDQIFKNIIHKDGSLELPDDKDLEILEVTKLSDELIF